MPAKIGRHPPTRSRIRRTHTHRQTDRQVITVPALPVHTEACRWHSKQDGKYQRLY